MQIDQLLTVGGTAMAIATSATAVLQSRRKPQLDGVNVDKIKGEISKESAAVNAKRDRHIIRLEAWAFEKVRPAWRAAVIIVDEQNDALVKLCAQSHITYSPKHLPDLPEMPQIDDD
jgi:hypothetical protein